VGSLLWRCEVGAKRPRICLHPGLVVGGLTMQLPLKGMVLSAASNFTFRGYPSANDVGIHEIAGLGLIEGAITSWSVPGQPSPT